MIEVFYTGCKNATVDFFVGNTHETVSSSSGVLTCTIPMNVGVHVLKLCLVSKEKIVVENVKVNGTGLREWLYLAWASRPDSSRYQCTELNSAGQCIYIPFATPMSHWIDLVLSKLSYHDMASDIHQTHDLYFSDQITLGQEFPPLVQDFFNNEFEFTVIEKSSKDLVKIPYVELTVDGKQTRSLASASLKLFESGQADHAVKKSLIEDKYLSVDDPAWQPESRSRMKIIDYTNGASTVLIDQIMLPEFYDLVSQLKIQNIYSAQINFLAPGAYTPPHRDYEVRDMGYPADADGCCQIYIPLISSEKNYLKISGVGLFEVGSKSLAINNNYYTHAVVNASDTVRSVLIIRCNFANNWHLATQRS